MKKITFLTFFLASIFALKAQVKHNKFTTRIMFDQFNPGNNFWNTTVTEIPNNAGYYLTNRKDGGNMNPSVVRLDVEGNIVMDSIYDFIPNNGGGFCNSEEAVSNVNMHTMLFSTGYLQSQMSLAAPYVVQLDSIGNINWHIGYAHDTLDLEARSIIATQDGGYLVSGTMYDWYNGIYPASGFAIKLDGSGTMEWQQLYANSDTMEIKFRDAIETPDGGFLFVGDAPNFQGGAKPPTPGNFDILMNIVHTDATGNINWSKAMNLDYPVDQGYGYGDFSVGMLNATDAFISYSIYDTTNGGADKFAITSLNTSTGINNWTKYYGLAAGGDISLRHAIADNNGNIILNASDYNGSGTGVIFVVDQDGNYVQSKRFTYANHANFPYNTIQTLDGGYAHLNEIDGNEVLLVKTDKLFDPSCPDVDSLYGGLVTNIIADSSYFGVIDSTYILSNVNPVQLSLGSPVVTSADDSLICSCSNMISGNVMDGATPVNNANVFLFRKGVVPKPWAPIDSIRTDPTGFYSFNYVPTDSFLVKVVPDPALNPNALISYHKHLDSCYNWVSAGVFHVHCDSASIVKDVMLITPPPLTGGSALNGYVFESAGSFNKKQPGDPIPGIDITVEQSPGGVIGGSTTTTGGFYDLSNLNNNSTYVVSVDYPGLPNDSVWTVAINLNDSTLDSLNFYVDSTGIYVLGNSFGVGVNNIQTDNIEMEIYPNPSNDVYNITLTAEKPESIIMELYNDFGQRIKTYNKSLSSGINKMKIDARNYAAGVYYLKIKEQNKLYIKKLIKF